MELTLKQVNDLPHIIAGNGEIRINCPDCHEENAKCYVNVDKQVYNCYVCGFKGRLVVDSEPDLKDFYINVETYLKSCTPTTRIDTTKSNIIKTLPPHREAHEVPRACNYLAGRCLSWNEMEDNDIKYTDTKDYPNSLLFPMYDIDSKYGEDKLGYFVTRTLDAIRQPKYKNAPWDKGDTLYKPVRMRSGGSNYDTLIDGVICEGVFDAIGISRTGFQGIALLGKRANTKQIERLIGQGSEGYIILLDGDAFPQAVDLWKQLTRMNRLIEKQIKIYLMHISGMDPADMAVKDLNGLRNKLNAAANHILSKKFKV